MLKKNRLFRGIKVCLFAFIILACAGIYWFYRPIQTDVARELLPYVKITNTKYNSRTSLVIEWKKQKDIDGYIVYAWEKDGKLISHKKIKDRDAQSCIIYNLSYDTPYKFAVVAYLDRNSSIEKGSYDPKGYVGRIKVTSRFENGYRYFYDWEGNRLTDNVTEFLSGSPRYQIRTNLSACVTTVYAVDDLGEYNTPVKAWLCSPGISGSTKTGVWKLGEKYRYRPLLYGTNSQWAVRIHDEILYHTTPYVVYGTNNTLDVGEYNKLGTPASHGCIRMQCEAVEWISDNCDEDTDVILYESDDPGGFGKPEFEPIPIWHTWDPTDSSARDYCRRIGCHKSE